MPLKPFFPLADEGKDYHRYHSQCDDINRYGGKTAQNSKIRLFFGRFHIIIKMNYYAV